MIAQSGKDVITASNPRSLAQLARVQSVRSQRAPKMDAHGEAPLVKARSKVAQVRAVIFNLEYLCLWDCTSRRLLSWSLKSHY